jgi:hypothetical protein
MAAGNSTLRPLRALVAVARAYRLAPRKLDADVWFALCPGCPPGAQGRSLALCATPKGARYLCRLCGAHGARLDGLQRIAEAANDDAPHVSPGDPRTALRAELAAAVDRHGDAARTACDCLADALTGQNLELDSSTRRGPRVVVGLPVVQAENDDAASAPAPKLCRCPACDGIDNRGEGDA